MSNGHNTTLNWPAIASHGLIGARLAVTGSTALVVGYALAVGHGPVVALALAFLGALVATVWAVFDLRALRRKRPAHRLVGGVIVGEPTSGKAPALGRLLSAQHDR